MDSIKLIDNGAYAFKDLVFENEIHLSSSTVSNPRFLRFFRCIFNFPVIIEELHYPNIMVNFSQCTFNKGVKVYRCNLLELRFTGIVNTKDILIEDSNLDFLRFNSENTLSDDFIINNSTIRNLDCSNLEDFRGTLLVEINRHSESNNDIECSFRNSSINSLQLYGNIGLGNFEGLSVKEGAFFSANFGTSYFNNSFFGLYTTFNDCEFSSTVSFKNCRVNNEMNFQVCTFKKHVFFSNAEFQIFSISDTTFEARVSFLGMEVENINLHLVNFNKLAHFEEVKIENILSTNRKTLRTIKQELQKTDNKIDYNRFRAYELAAYYNELDWRNGFKDKAILWATKHVTGFEHSWSKALGFVLSAAFVFFTLFFVSENYDLQMSWSGIPKYITGYFRFLLVTDFYNPLNSGREFISNDGWNHIASWFIFILGKIVIAFGIYEMIQAFRKFKA